MQVPVIGWTPLKSLEQLGALGVFFILQAMYYCEIQRVKDDLDADALQALRMRVFGICGAVGFALVACIWPTGYFGPLSSRIRGLFVQHTRTGNPLVDSVAEPFAEPNAEPNALRKTKRKTLLKLGEK